MIRRAVLMAFLICISASAFAADQAPTAASNQDESIGRKLSWRLGVYEQKTLFSFGNNNDGRRERWRKAYEQLTTDQKVHYCITQLQNESWCEIDVPSSKEPYSTTPEVAPSLELIKLGRSAIPQLLIALNCGLSTKIYPTRHRGDTWLVQDAAIDVIERIACKHFGGNAGYQLSGVQEKERRELRKEVADWWAANKGSDEVQWAKDTLFSETAPPAESRWMAIDSLYFRLGKESYPVLAKAYHRLPKGREDADGFDETRSRKLQILQWLLKSPAASAKAVFDSALHDAPLWVRIDGAEGLQAIGDPSGLEAMVKEAKELALNDRGPAGLGERPWSAASVSIDSGYYNMTSFLVRCNTPGSREAVYEWLRGRNPFLREEAIYEVPTLHMEKAVRALPELFGDPFVLEVSYTEMIGSVERNVPPRRVCDAAAETFAKMAPDAPRFAGETAEEQQNSIEKLKRWWNENNAHLEWDEKAGVLMLPKK